MYDCSENLVKKVTVYKASDGEIFNSEDEAWQHELDLKKQKVKALQKEVESLVKQKDEAMKELSKETGGKVTGGKYMSPERQNILDTIPEVSGIYMFTNIHDGYKKYIGSAKLLRTRATNFLNFNPEYHYGGGKRLEDARKKFNNASHWAHTILELCPASQLCEREDYYIDALNTRNPELGYNVKGAGRNVASDKTDGSNHNGVPTSILNLYNTYVAGTNNNFGLNGGKKERCEQLPINEFWGQMKKIGITTKPDTASLTTRVKTVFDEYQDKKIAEKISLVPREVLKIMNNNTCLDHDGFPGMIRKIADNEQYMYVFKSSFSSEAGVPDSKAGFSSRKEAYKGLLAAKVNMVRYYIRKYKNDVDSETIELFDHITYREAENLFVNRTSFRNVEKSIVFGGKDGDEEVPELVSDKLTENARAV